MDASDREKGEGSPRPADDADRGPAMKRKGWERPAVNVSALLSSTTITRATRFAIYAMVGRSLGAGDLGRVAIAVALLQLIGRGSLLGLPTLVTREVAADPTTARTYLRRGALVIAAAAVAGYAVLFGVTTAMGYEGSTTRVIWLLFAGLIPFGMAQLTQSILVGLERARYVAFANTPINLLQTVVVFSLLQLGHDVNVVALALGIEFLAMAIVQLAMIVRHVPPVREPSSWSARSLVRAALPFLGMDWALVLRTSATALIISVVLDEAAVGIYAAAAQLQIPLRLAGQAMGTALFPVMVRAQTRGIQVLRQATGRVLGVVLMVVLPGATGLLLLADDLLRLVYAGGEFAEASLALRILAVGAVALSAASILGRSLVATGMELVTMRISLVNTATLIPASLLLTSLFGVTGAASAVALVATVNVGQHFRPVQRLFGSLPRGGGLRPTIIACAVMALVVAPTQSTLHVLASVLIGVVAYGAALGAIMLWSAGGWDNLRLDLSTDSAMNEAPKQP